MKLSFDWRGLVEDGLECCWKKDDEFKSEVVTDLSGWLKRRFLELREADDRRECLVWIGSGEFPFVAIYVDKRKFRLGFCHPEINTRYEYKTEFSDVDDAVATIASGAFRVSSLEWQPTPRKWGINFSCETPRPRT